MAERFVFQELGDEWVVEMSWLDGDYQGGPAAMWIRPVDPDAPPPGGLSSTVLREINFRDAKAKLVKNLTLNPQGWRGPPEKQAEREAKNVEHLRNQLANGVTPEYLALLASNYIRRVNSGQPKPVERLAEDLGKPLQTIRGHLWKAKKQGLLVGSPGKKGGELTVEAMTILQQMPKAIMPPEAKSLVSTDPPGGTEDEQGDR